MHEIFISYRRDDTAGFVDRLYEGLVHRYGERAVFIDRTIEPGGDFPDVIREAVEKAPITLVVIGPRWLEPEGAGGRRRIDEPGDWVAEEVRLALLHARQAAAQPRRAWVVPVLIGMDQMPRPEELPETLRELADKQLFRLTRDHWQDDLRKLTRQIDRWLRTTIPLPVALKRAALPAAVALLAALAVWWLSLLDIVPPYRWARDALDRWTWAESPLRGDDLALVVDFDPGDDSLASRASKRSQHARLIAGLARAGAAVIAFDYEFPDRVDEQADGELEAAIRSAPVPVVVGARAVAEQVDAGGGVRAAFERPGIHDGLASAVGDHWGLIQLEGEDEVRYLPALEIGRLRQAASRRLSSGDLLPSLALRAAMLRYGAVTGARFDDRGRVIRLSGGERSPPGIPVRAVGRPGKSPVLLFRFRLTERAAFEPERYANLLERLDREQPDWQALERKYRGRIVLVGSSADSRRSEFKDLPGYEIQAQLVANLLSERYVTSPRLGAALGVVASVLLAVGWRLRRRRPREIVESQSPYRYWLLAGVDALGGTLLLVAPLVLAAWIAFATKVVRLPIFYWMLSFAMTYVLLAVAERRARS